MIVTERKTANETRRLNEVSLEKLSLYDFKHFKVFYNIFGYLTHYHNFL